MDVAALRSRLAEEAAERDEARRASRRLRRILELHCRRLAAVAGTPPSSHEEEIGATTNLAQRARDIVRELEIHVRHGGHSDVELDLEIGPGGSAGAGEQSNSLDLCALPAPPRGCGLLRQSLDEAQRRCKSLSNDMVQQTQTNEELVDALGTVKDANKRLLEQIRFQTDEIAQLTQQRITDQERLDHISNRHRSDQEAARLDVQRQVLLARNAATGEFQAKRARLEDRLRGLRARLEVIQLDASRLSEQHCQLQGEAASLADSFQTHGQAAVQDATTHCNNFVDLGERARAAVEESIRDLQEKLSSERDLFQHDSLAWGHRYSSLGADIEDIRARMTRDMTQLTSHLQALERIVVAERQSWMDECSGLQGTIDEVLLKQSSRREEVDSMKRNIVRMESSLRGAQIELHSQEQAVEELRRQLRENDDALSAARSGNEHLQRQTEEQRKRFYDRNAADLAANRAVRDRRLEEQGEAHEKDIALMSRQLQELEEHGHKDDEALRQARQQLDALNAECQPLQEDAAAHCLLQEKVQSARQDLERELADARQAAAQERLRLQAECDRLTAAATAAGQDIRQTEHHVGEFRRATAAREANHCARFAAGEAALRSSHERLDELRRRLLETTDAQVRVAKEAAAGRQRAVATQAALEQSLEDSRRTAQETRRRLAEALTEEQCASEQAKLDCQLERESGLALLRRTEDDSKIKLDTAEHNRARIEESRKLDLAEAGEAAAEHQRRCGMLEHDLNNVRNQLAESEANLEWLREEFERDEHDKSVSLSQLRDDARSTEAALERAIREDATLGRQLEEAKHRQSQEQAKLAGDLQEIKASTAATATDHEQRSHGAKPVLHALEPHARIGGCCDTESTGQPTPTTQRHLQPAQQEILERENIGQHRNLISDQGRSSMGLSNLHMKLESHIQRLQRHTEELRSSLHSSASAGRLATAAAASLMPGSPSTALVTTAATMSTAGALGEVGKREGIEGGHGAAESVKGGA